MALKAIETVYNGYRFRSRLEARWAVFFDTLGVKYQYEPEGYDLDGIYYLPDFYLPGSNIFVEVKPTKDVTDIEREKAKLLVKHSGKSLLMVFDCLPGNNAALFFNNVYYGKRTVEEAEVVIMACTICKSLGLFVSEFVWEIQPHNCGWKSLSTHDGLIPQWGWTEKEYNNCLSQAYKAAQQARFEFGEKP